MRERILFFVWVGESRPAVCMALLLRCTAALLAFKYEEIMMKFGFVHILVCIVGLVYLVVRLVVSLQVPILLVEPSYVSLTVCLPR